MACFVGCGGFAAHLARNPDDSPDQTGVVSQICPVCIVVQVVLQSDADMSTAGDPHHIRPELVPPDAADGPRGAVGQQREHIAKPHGVQRRRPQRPEDEVLK